MPSYYIAGKQIIPWDVSYISDDGVEHTIAIPATATADVPAGLYHWILRVTDGTDTFTVLEGDFTVATNVATASNADLQTHAERMVALLESEIESRILGTGSAAGMYSIGGRQLQKIPILELRQLLATYRAELAALRQVTTGGFGRRILSRFTVPS